MFSLPSHLCLTYDGGKDLYKVFIDGVKTESGSWAGDNPMEAVRLVPSSPPNMLTQAMGHTVPTISF